MGSAARAARAQAEIGAVSLVRSVEFSEASDEENPDVEVGRGTETFPAGLQWHAAACVKF